MQREDLRPMAVAPILGEAKNSFPFLDLKAQFACIHDEILAAVGNVLESQNFILGPEVEAFEREVAALIGCEYAIECASGTDALILALLALDIGHGDEAPESVHQPRTRIRLRTRIRSARRLRVRRLPPP